MSRVTTSVAPCTHAKCNGVNNVFGFCTLGFARFLINIFTHSNLSAFFLSSSLFRIHTSPNAVFPYLSLSSKIFNNVASDRFSRLWNTYSKERDLCSSAALWMIFLQFLSLNLISNASFNTSAFNLSMLSIGSPLKSTSFDRNSILNNSSSFFLVSSSSNWTAPGSSVEGPVLRLAYWSSVVLSCFLLSNLLYCDLYSPCETATDTRCGLPFLSWV